MTIRKLTLDERLQELEEFEDGFKRSGKGNLWRRYDGASCTVFETDRSTYKWCVADGDDITYADEEFDDEETALLELATYLDVGAEGYVTEHED